MRKRFLIPLVIVVAASIWSVRQQEIRRCEAVIEQARAHQEELSTRLEKVTSEIAALRQTSQQQEPARRELMNAVAQAEREVVQISPESLRATPPSDPPRWDVQSPFVWVRKGIVGQLNTPAFQEDGSLLPPVAQVMAVSPAQLKQLNQTLPSLLAQYRQLETTNIVFSDDHLRPVTDGKALTVQWKPLPEQGAQLKAQFISAMKKVIGSQRTGILLSVHGPRLDDDFGLSEMNSETERKITLVRHANDSFYLSARRGSFWISTAAPYDYRENLVEHIPPHVRPHFAALLDLPPN